MEELNELKETSTENDTEKNDNESTITAFDDEATQSPVFNSKQLERKKDRLNREKRKRFQGYVRSRKLKRKIKHAKLTEEVINPISIGAMNVTSTSNAMPYKRYRSEMLEIVSQNAILNNRTRVNRRTSQPFDYKAVVSQTRSTSPKKLNKTLPMVIKKEQNNVSNQFNVSETHGRNRRRINYSEELVDEAFMYEQILQDKQHQQEKRKRSLIKAAQKSPESISSIGSGNLDSRIRLLEQRNEISIVPVKSRVMSKEKHTDGRHSASIKQEPLFNITSSVSVHIKSRKSVPTPNIRISNITSLHGNRETTSKKPRKISCEYCRDIFPNENALAIHQLVHMRISAYRIDAKRILHPKLRRVSSKTNIKYLYFYPRKIRFNKALM